MLRKTAISCLLLATWAVLYGQAGDSERQLYVDRYSALAIQEMERTGVPASIKLGQAILESRWGTSELARNANNHFGIKCGGRWQGPSYYKEDDDYVLGKLVPSCFRGYPSAEASYVAHSDFLLRNSRYAELFALNRTNYKAWARGLKKAGYATARDYHKKLIRIIEELKLYQYDRMKATDVTYIFEALAENGQSGVDPQASPPGQVPVNPPRARAGERNTPMEPLQVLMNNDIKFVVSEKGQTVAELAQKLRIPTEWLLAYNDHIEEATQTLEGGQWIYIQAKRKNFRGRQKWHEVMAGENMFGLSQRYGISLQALYERNQMVEGTEPAPGARIKLRGGKVKTAPALRPLRGTGPTQGAVPGAVGEDRNSSINMITPPIRLELSDNPSSAKLPEVEESTISSGAIYHRVELGDTLESIARRYQRTPDQIRDWNALAEGAPLKPGTRLRVQ